MAAGELDAEEVGAKALLASEEEDQEREDGGEDANDEGEGRLRDLCHPMREGFEWDCEWRAGRE